MQNILNANWAIQNDDPGDDAPHGNADITIVNESGDNVLFVAGLDNRRYCEPSEQDAKRAEIQCIARMVAELPSLFRTLNGCLPTMEDALAESKRLECNGAARVTESYQGQVKEIRRLLALVKEVSP